MLLLSYWYLALYVFMEANFCKALSPNTKFWLYLIIRKTSNLSSNTNLTFKITTSKQNTTFPKTSFSITPFLDLCAPRYDRNIVQPSWSRLPYNTTTFTIQRINLELKIFQSKLLVAVASAATVLWNYNFVLLMTVAGWFPDFCCIFSRKAARCPFVL